MTLNVFPKEIEQLFWQHAIEQYPKEACGLIIDGGTQYIPMKNIHETPRINFRMNFAEFNEYYMAGRVSALMHSHTASHPVPNKFPSRMDMVMQEKMQVPWGIVHISESRDIDGPFYFGDQVPIAPLIGRVFRPNVHDCFVLLRDIYRIEEKVTLPIFPREAFWWQAKKNVLGENFEKAGFERIDKTQLTKNNVILSSLSAPASNKVVNHIMIVRENGLVYHHLRDRLSRPDPLNMWVNAGSVFLKYVGPRDA